jgi:transposase
MRETGMHWGTLEKILRYPAPPGYQKSKRGNRKNGCNKWNSDHYKDIRKQIHDAIQLILKTFNTLPKKALPKRDLRLLIRELQKAGFIISPLDSYLTIERTHHQWMSKVVQGAEPLANIQRILGQIEDLSFLVEKAANGKLRDRNRAIAILAHLRGISFRSIARFIHRHPSQVSKYWRKYETGGCTGLFTYYPPKAKKSENEEIKSEFFSLLHSPPSEHNINRTSWILNDLKKCLCQKGIHVSRDVIREMIRAAKYKWRKAKIVLTSNDPEYREKLNHIKSILSSLGKNDRFFSIDEFGPFAVKMKGGRRLVAPDEYPHVPQFQISKGCLIITAALELSKNQVTHFYSKNKNTTEMIKLLHLLLRNYKGCRRIYLSWDSASWHASEAFCAEVEEVNKRAYRKSHCTPIVKLAPLPASAQFLNVIESIFSGMARAIIHNSNYQSIEEAMAAIDRYFEERNEHFRKHPKKAGNKIWRKELVPSKFSEGQNCKDPNW